MGMDVHGFWSLIRGSARILIILACFESTQAGSLQEAAIKDGCSKYQDRKSIEPLKKFVEPAMDKGCVACHLDCSRLSPAHQKEPPEFYLKAKEPDLCLECHADPKMKDLSPTHDKQPLGNSKCTGCHDPHSSDTPKLLLKFSHGPYAARLCSACHPAPVEGKVRLAAADVDLLCYGCHSQFKAEMEGTKSRHKLLSQSNRACMECHDPHAANQEFDLKKPVQELCLGCHVAKPGQVPLPSTPGAKVPPDWAPASNELSAQYLKLSSKYVHAPAEKSCLICHDAHASEFPDELRVPVRDLCMDCHGPNSEKIVQSSQPFPLFNGLVSLPPKTFEKLKRFELSSKYVHEPVNQSCAFCHDAHASDYPTELYAPVQDVCFTCHGLEATKLYKGDQPYPLFGGRVILPPKPFKNLKILNLVNGRLGHPTSKHPVGGAATEDYPEFNCATCHTPHSSSTSPTLLMGDKEKLCYSQCHKM
jgi:predicted CXXCH cytochrome family protein